MLRYLLNHCFANEGSDSRHLAPDKHQFLARNLNSSLAARRLVRDWSTYTLGCIIGFWLNYSIFIWVVYVVLWRGLFRGPSKPPWYTKSQSFPRHLPHFHCWYNSERANPEYFGFFEHFHKNVFFKHHPNPQYYSLVCFWKSLHIEKFSR